jgi:hypothetical protein
MVAEAEVVIEAVPNAASYPVANKYCLSVERVNKHSDVAVPEFVILLLLPETVVGSGMDCTNVPAVVYSSKKPAVAALLNAAAPSPDL